jgi:hypothetical protein
MDSYLRIKRNPDRQTYPLATGKLSTVPIVRVREDTGLLDFEGSGVLLTYRNRHFLGTAAHVVDFPEGHSAIVGACSPAIKLFGKIFQRNERHKPDSEAIDFAVTELNGTEASALAVDARFVSLDSATPYEPRYKHLCYALTGFLANDNFADNSRSMLSANALQISVRRDHRSLKHDRARKANSHWYVEGIYDPQDARFDTWSPNQRPKSFKGFSGGAFYLDDPFCPGVFNQFAGIILECTRPDCRGQRILTGIGARAIIDMLRHWYPDLEPAPIREPKSYILHTPQPVIYVPTRRPIEILQACWQPL